VQLQQLLQKRLSCAAMVRVNWRINDLDRIASIRTFLRLLIFCGFKLADTLIMRNTRAAVDEGYC
jgi:hypothetical protein